MRLYQVVADEKSHTRHRGAMRRLPVPRLPGVLVPLVTQELAREVNGPVQVPHPQPTPTSFPVFSANRKHPAQHEPSLESIL